MIAAKVTAEVLRQAAESIGVRADINTINQNGTRHRVKLYPDAWEDPENALTPGGNRRKDERGNRKYQRISASAYQNDRRVHAVCWHGFRDYFRAVYRLTPGAVFSTAVDRWQGSEDFEARYKASGHRNVGSQMAPRCAAEVCACPESGMAV